MVVYNTEGEMSASLRFKPYAKRKAAAPSHRAARARVAVSQRTRNSLFLRLREFHWLIRACSRAIAIETSALTCAQGANESGAIRAAAVP